MGLVSKRSDRPYRGGRSKDWIKIKNQRHHAFDRVKQSFSWCATFGLDDWIRDISSQLDISSLQLTLDDIESDLKREHGERCPPNDGSSRQDQERRHLNPPWRPFV